MAVLKKITYKKIAVSLLIVFMITLLPILYCSFFDYATGDDLWEGAAAYRVLANHGTVKDFFGAVFEMAKIDYLGWEGNWSSIILWCLEPSIWGEKVYCITPWIALIALCGGTLYFLNYYLKKYMKCDNLFLIIVFLIISFFSIQYMPYPRSGIFWYTGMINYVVPYGLCLASFVWMDKYITDGKKRYLLLITLVFTYLGGAGYMPVVLAFEGTILFLLGYLFDTSRRERLFWLLVPLLLLIIGFVISAISPGNAARGGESYYFSVEKVFITIIESIKQGFLGGIKWFITIRPLFLTVPLLMITVWEQIDLTKVEIKFRFPVLVLGLLFLISCSVYAPGIYAQTEVSGGVPDSIYFVFLLMYVLGIIYLTCWLKKIFMDKGNIVFRKEQEEKLRGFISLGVILFCLVFGRHLIGNMTSYTCVAFIKSGQLKDFEYQMQERLKILHNPEIENVVLPEMNDKQGPFMHFPITADPSAYTNMATARFYGKESVVAIPRTEYYDIYGHPEKR
ncbi:MAG: DUF6056 family protein [Lachnospiraceae bacterium]|nr:DUF6056 family protein [Lachnospiraceae bacterium]